jgi:glucoamylase
MDSANPAPGAPGIPGRWTSSAKTMVGTALSRTSRVWFTVSHGILNEIYYPRLDHACTRDMGLLVTDGRDFFSEEKRHTESKFSYIAEGTPACLLVNTDVAGRYAIEKEILTDPDLDVALQRTRFMPLQGAIEDYHLYVLLSPHLNNQGQGNTGWCEEYKGRRLLLAQRDVYALALACSHPFLQLSVGYVGTSDAWQDIARHKRMTWNYDRAESGNVALAAEIDLAASRGEFVLAIGFGDTWADAAQSAVASLQDGFDDARDEYKRQWQDWHRTLRSAPLAPRERDLRRVSAAVLRTHEDKSFPGALAASLSVPWGFSKGDNDLGGYHLVWPRDLVESAGGLLAIGDFDNARAVLRYLQATQEADGHWAQNMWLQGLPYWSGIQMDETALPILFLDQLRREEGLGSGGLARFWPMARKAAGYLVRNGPVTQEDRWETDPGYSPFTLAAEIAGLLAAAELAEESGEPGIAGYLRETADVWNDNIERWIYVTHTKRCFRFGIDGYYVRIAGDGGEETRKHILSPDFLALVRFGLRDACDPRITDTLRAVDEELKVQLPGGPAWRRYEGDPYGEHEDGSPYDGGGIGRAWPLLTGERAHYELAAGRTPQAEALLAALERFGNEGGMLPEQLWDSHDIPDRELFFGRPSGSAMPLAWAHAEYLKLRRSLAEGRVYDMPPQPYERYVLAKTASPRVIWRFSHKLASMPRGKMLRVETTAPAGIHWSTDGWHTASDTHTTDSRLGMHYADLPVGLLPAGAQVAFTFYWTESANWEGQNFEVRVE